MIYLILYEINILYFRNVSLKLVCVVVGKHSDVSRHSII